ncbi:MAG: short-chain dehydrogenase, partial [Deltaproteobacteria bacterium]|nr:short-chain dehydrogenase [Deltaproteobacteria bacterium]
MQSRDMVGTVLYLASSWSDAVTGQLCPVDRGLVKY